MGFNQHQRGPVFNGMHVVAMLPLQLVPELFRGAKEATSMKVDALFREECR